MHSGEPGSGDWRIIGHGPTKTEAATQATAYLHTHVIPSGAIAVAIYSHSAVDLAFTSLLRTYLKPPPPEDISHA